MPLSRTILVVDDNAVNRTILSKILSEEYLVIQAENGLVAMEQLKRHPEDISAIMLDLVMPVMDGYAVLEALKSNPHYYNLPIIITTENSGSDNEIKALARGAWDFVSKPYSPQIIHFRLKNAIDRSQLSALKQLQYLAEYDVLTGIYNKAKFFEATRTMIDANPEQCFVFFRLDVDRFQLINSFFGAAEGDKLLIYIAKSLQRDTKDCDKVAYGRIESDIFGLCLPYQQAQTESIIRKSKGTLDKYNPNYDIVPSIGIYIVEDPAISVEEMYNRATLAAKTCKGNYVEFCAYYNEGMSASLTTEQEITNDMNIALESGQFQIYLQPQYNIHTNLPCGAEALVRWMHPKKGMLSPALFIPIFERNGFISRLDYYVWELACQCLHRWLEQGKKPYPLSVNISRVNLYNPKLAETLLALVRRYQIEPSLLNLELTESAYTDNPTAMMKTMSQLQSYGFTIMMDDFGNGYSSLSLLKDIEIDILKIDMRFLSNTRVPGRGENIIASVIRMAKWLNIPVIAEGAETVVQVDFLRSVGCDYVQGYYFARPMPVSDYEQLCTEQAFDAGTITDKKYDNYRYNDLFSANSEMKTLFNSALQAAAIYEFADNQAEVIRVNEAYYALLGHDEVPLEEEQRAALLQAFRICSETQEATECEYIRHPANKPPIWIHMKLHHVFTADDKHILIGELTDVTMRKAIDSGIQKYRELLLSNNGVAHTVLIVDDAAVNRTVLKTILQHKFLFLEAADGEEAVKILQENRSQIDLILLDITMPRMDGKAFLQYKKNRPELDGIPVIMITADDSSAQQISTLMLGANDYIVKPFIPEVVVRRVQNVLDSSHRFKEMVREYNTMSEQVKTDQMTGLLNRTSAEGMIAQYLKNTTNVCAMVMLDIDNFKRYNDTRGHAYGDRVIMAVGEKLRGFFRQGDIVARMGGDEFAVLMGNMGDLEIIELKVRQLCRGISNLVIDGKNAGVTCSAGIALSSKEVHSFEALYQKADKALYTAKCRGKNTVSVYEHSATTVTQWISEADSFLGEINDGVYACNKDNYELLYANDHICKLLGITREACRGHKCYEVIMKRTEPCEFCSLSKGITDGVYTRLIHLPDKTQLFLMRGENVNQNGAMVHLEVAVDVTKIENMSLYKEVTLHGADEQP